MASLESEARCAPTWELEDPSQFLSEAMITVLEQTCNADEPLLAAALTSLRLGQRIGDVLSIKAEDIHGVGESTLAVQMTDAKVTKRKGVFTLAIPLQSFPGKLLLSMRGAALAQNESYLFKTMAQHGNRQVENLLHQRLLALWGLKIDLRSLRRTGLSKIASAGAPLTTVMAISKHSTVQMLERYLANGLFHGAQHTEMKEAYSAAWNSHLPRVW
jgi:integrase